MRVVSLSPGRPRSARETVAVETPAARATSAMLETMCSIAQHPQGRGFLYSEVEGVFQHFVGA